MLTINSESNGPESIGNVATINCSIDRERRLGCNVFVCLNGLAERQRLSDDFLKSGILRITYRRNPSVEESRCIEAVEQELRNENISLEQALRAFPGKKESEEQRMSDNEGNLEGITVSTMTISIGKSPKHRIKRLSDFAYVQMCVVVRSGGTSAIAFAYGERRMDHKQIRLVREELHEDCEITVEFVPDD